MAFQGPYRDGEEPFYTDSDHSSADDKLPNVQISNPMVAVAANTERDLGTGGYKAARFKNERRKYESSNSLLYEDRTASFSTTASVEFDSEENISNADNLFWLRHPRVRENCKTVAAAFLLFFGGLVFLVAGIALSGLKEEEDTHKAIIFFVCAAICIIPGGYHIIYIYRATRGEKGYSFESIPSFK